MDSELFDTLVRGLAWGMSRRGAVVGLAALTGSGLASITAAKAKKHKKKHKKKNRCLPAKRTCATGAATRCCAGLTCGSNDCAGGASCLRERNAPCAGSCDCVGPFSAASAPGRPARSVQTRVRGAPTATPIAV